MAILVNIYVLQIPMVSGWLFSFLKVLDEQWLELDYFIALVSVCCFLSNTERSGACHRLASMNKVLSLIMKVDGVALLAF